MFRADNPANPSLAYHVTTGDKVYVTVANGDAAQDVETFVGFSCL